MPETKTLQVGPSDQPFPTTDPEPDQKWRKPRPQIAALPFRFDDGQLQVLLITSRETRRWVIPKGWPMRGLKPHRAAEREAYEEAGLKGRVRKAAVGTYGYEKRLANGVAVPCEVSVFPLQVASQRKRWPEMGQREGRWFRPDEAAELVQEEGLQHLLRGIEPLIGAKATRGAKASRSEKEDRGRSKSGRMKGSVNETHRGVARRTKR